MLKQINLPLRVALPICFGFVLSAVASVLGVEPGPEILLWPKGAPGSEGKTGEVVVRIAERGERVLSNIHKPSLTPYLPVAGQASG